MNIELFFVVLLKLFLFQLIGDSLQFGKNIVKQTSKFPRNIVPFHRRDDPDIMGEEGGCESRDELGQLEVGVDLAIEEGPTLIGLLVQFELVDELLVLHPLLGCYRLCHLHY